ncbi:PP2C family protein-serine/threonine phosphatase [Streptomyces sp. RFCAC02]|uniref:PP2C family protein-serine/threonine phosphatase n=1 Tax=Streptomyces sp. RFCAC02 TaxID=2499143 RepID=UPI001021D6FC|nr:PP2C family protein-serine/threonine phosphatase [Streptomyces sp. RFCAC02]
MSSAAPAGRAHGAGDGPVWESVPFPVVVADAGGTVLHASPRAAALLPDAAPGTSLSAAAPSWLAAAHRRVTGGTGSRSHHPDDHPVSGRLADRTLRALPVSARDGTVAWWLTDETELRGLDTALDRARQRAAFLAEASSRLLASLNTDRCMETIASLAATHLADAALVVAATSGQAGPVAHCVRGGEPGIERLVPDPARLPELDAAFTGHLPATRRLAPGAVPDWAVPSGFGPVGSAVVAPLPGRGTPVGALVLLYVPDRPPDRLDAVPATHDDPALRNSAGSGDGADDPDSADYFVRLFAARAGAAFTAARLYGEQAAITRTLTRDLLPPRVTALRGVEFASGYRPSGVGESVGGDFFDVHPDAADGAEPLVVLGDVSGKGLDAAVLTGKIRSTLRALAPLAADHERVLHLLNSALLGTAGDRFATLVLASVRPDPADGTVRLRLTSAGHLPPLVVRTDGTVDEVAAGGTLIGVLPETEAHTVTAVLAPGDVCLLYTDGITEARGGPLGDAFFGDGRLRAALAETAGLPAEAIVEHVQMLVSQWIGPRRHDDIALVALRAPAPPAAHRTGDGPG